MKKKFLIGAILVAMIISTVSFGAMKGVSFNLEKFTLGLGTTQNVKGLISTYGHELDYDNFTIEDTSVIKMKPNGDIEAIGTGLSTLYYEYEPSEGTTKTIKCYVEVKATQSSYSNITDTYYTITLYNGDISTTIQGKKGYKPELPEFKKDGYYFDGWYLDSDYTNPYTLTWLNSNLTLYSKWTKNEVNNQTSNQATNKYTDLGGLWSASRIEYVTRQGVFNGTSETTFSPNAPMTRGMLVTVLGRFYGVKATGRTSKFVDVEKGSYYEEYVAWAEECGIVHGVSDTEFEPNRNITTEEFATVLGNYINYTKKSYEKNEKINFADADEISEWAVDGVLTAQSCTLLKDLWKNTEYEGKLMPKKDITRAEVAIVFYNYLMIGRK